MELGVWVWPRRLIGRCHWHHGLITNTMVGCKTRRVRHRPPPCLPPLDSASTEAPMAQLWKPNQYLIALSRELQRCWRTHDVANLPEMPFLGPGFKVAAGCHAEGDEGLIIFKLSFVTDSRKNGEKARRRLSGLAYDTSAYRYWGVYSPKYCDWLGNKRVIL